MSAAPELGCRAWEPFRAASHHRVLNRFNGVPTLGFFTLAGTRYLFWEALGYVTDAFSVWIYVPVDPEDEESPGLPDGVVFDSPAERIAVAAVAHDNRLIFEREWNIPAGMDTGELLHDLTHFLKDAIDEAAENDLPPGRLAELRTASVAFGGLAEAS